VAFDLVGVAGSKPAASLSRSNASASVPVWMSRTESPSPVQRSELVALTFARMVKLDAAPRDED
jgi:type IV secretory pathway protease TraF